MQTKKPATTWPTNQRAVLLTAKAMGKAQPHAILSSMKPYTSRSFKKPNLSCPSNIYPKPSPASPRERLWGQSSGFVPIAQGGTVRVNSSSGIPLLTHVSEHVPQSIRVTAKKLNPNWLCFFPYWSYQDHVKKLPYKNYYKAYNQRLLVGQSLVENYLALNENRGVGYIPHSTKQRDAGAVSIFLNGVELMPYTSSSVEERPGSAAQPVLEPALVCSFLFVLGATTLFYTGKKNLIQTLLTQPTTKPDPQGLSHYSLWVKCVTEGLNVLQHFMAEGSTKQVCGKPHTYYNQVHGHTFGYTDHFIWDLLLETVLGPRYADEYFNAYLQAQRSQTFFKRLPHIKHSLMREVGHCCALPLIYRGITNPMPTTLVERIEKHGNWEVPESEQGLVFSFITKNVWMKENHKKVTNALKSSFTKRVAKQASQEPSYALQE